MQGACGLKRGSAMVVSLLSIGMDFSGARPSPEPWAGDHVWVLVLCANDQGAPQGHPAVLGYKCVGGCHQEWTHRRQRGPFFFKSDLQEMCHHAAGKLTSGSSLDENFC